MTSMNPTPAAAISADIKDKVAVLDAPFEPSGPLPEDNAPLRKRRRRAPASGAAADCFACQDRQTKCDRRRPYCTPCLDRGKDCSGYKTALTWGVGVASRGKLRGLSLPVANSKRAAQSDDSICQNHRKDRSVQQQQFPPASSTSSAHSIAVHPSSKLSKLGPTRCPPDPNATQTLPLSLGHPSPPDTPRQYPRPVEQQLHQSSSMVTSPQGRISPYLRSSLSSRHSISASTTSIATTPTDWGFAHMDPTSEPSASARSMHPPSRENNWRLSTSDLHVPTSLAQSRALRRSGQKLRHHSLQPIRVASMHPSRDYGVMPMTASIVGGYGGHADFGLSSQISPHNADFTSYGLLSPTSSAKDTGSPSTSDAYEANFFTSNCLSWTDAQLASSTSSDQSSQPGTEDISYFNNTGTGHMHAFGDPILEIDPSYSISNSDSFVKDAASVTQPEMSRYLLDTTKFANYNSEYIVL